MAKHNHAEDEDRELIVELRRLVQDLREHIGRQSADRESESVEDVMDSHLLRTLRAIRPIVESYGDKQAIDKFNYAIRYAKNQARNPALVSDQRSTLERGGPDDAEAFGAAARRYHGKADSSCRFPF